MSALGLNDRAASFQSPTAHVFGALSTGGVAVTAAAVLSSIAIVISWAHETVTGGKEVIHAATAGLADTIETLFFSLEDVIREIGRAAARMSLRFGHEFEMTLITARFCTTSLMIAVAVLLFLYLTLVASEDEAFSLDFGVLPVMGRFPKTTYEKGRLFIWGRKRQQVDDQTEPTEVLWPADAHAPGELIAAEGEVTVAVPERSEMGTQVGHPLQDRAAQATEEANAAASAPVVMSHVPSNYHGVVAPQTQIVMHRLEKISGYVESVCAGAVQPRLPAMPDCTKDSAPRPLEPDWIL